MTNKDNRRKNQKFFEYNFLTKDRKGTHVGMILSFMIFVTFLAFIYVVLEPAISRQQTKDNFLEYLKNEITLQSTEVLMSVIISNNTDPKLNNCLVLNNSNFLNESLINFSKLSVVVKDNNSNLIVASITSDNNHTLINWEGNETFFKAFYSEEGLEEDLLGGWYSVCDFPFQFNYHQGLAQAHKRIFSEKLINFTQEYKLDYESVKRRLRVPETSEFDFNFTLSNGTIFSATGINPSKNIYSGEYPIQYVDSEANIQFGKLNIRVW